jgi:microcompartment protein CcmK/EutM
MGVTASEVGYTSATAGRGDHEVYKGHLAAWGGAQRQHVKNGEMAVKAARIGVSDQVNLRCDHHFLSFCSDRLPFTTA